MRTKEAAMVVPSLRRIDPSTDRSLSLWALGVTLLSFLRVEVPEPTLGGSMERVMWAELRPQQPELSQSQNTDSTHTHMTSKGSQLLKWHLWLHLATWVSGLANASSDCSHHLCLGAVGVFKHHERNFTSCSLWPDIIPWIPVVLQGEWGLQLLYVHFADADEEGPFSSVPAIGTHRMCLNPKPPFAALNISFKNALQSHPGSTFLAQEEGQPSMGPMLRSGVSTTMSRLWGDIADHSTERGTRDRISSVSRSHWTGEEMRPRHLDLSKATQLVRSHTTTGTGLWTPCPGPPSLLPIRFTESHKYTANETSESSEPAPFPTLAAAHATPWQLCTPPSSQAWTLPSVCPQGPPSPRAGRGRDTEKPENRYSLGNWMTDTERLKYCSPFLGISSWPEEGNTRNLISKPIWAIFLYSVFIYFTFFSKPLSTNSNRPASRPPRGSPITKYCWFAKHTDSFHRTGSAFFRHRAFSQLGFSLVRITNKHHHPRPPALASAPATPPFTLTHGSFDLNLRP